MGIKIFAVLGSTLSLLLSHGANPAAVRAPAHNPPMVLAAQVRSADIKPADAKPAKYLSAKTSNKSPDVNQAYIQSLVTTYVNQLVAQGVLKGQQGDKGDPGTSAGASFGSSSPDDGVAAPAPITYNSNIPGNIGGFTELSAGDFSAGTSLTVSAGAPLEVDGPANFTSGITDNDLNVGTIESPVSGANFDGYSWTDASSRDLKENFATVTPLDVLAKIDSLPIYNWNYKTQTASSTHIGPTAEDFYADFSLGNSSSSISTIDPAGVALAGIQGLDQKISSLMDISWITDGLKNLGVKITQGIIKVEALVADSVQSKTLEVGTSDAPTGITIYDTATGQPVCVFSENNVLQESAGKCQAANLMPSPAASPAPAPSSVSTDTSSTTPTSITEPIPNDPSDPLTITATSTPTDIATATPIDVSSDSDSSTTPNN